MRIRIATVLAAALAWGAIAAAPIEAPPHPETTGSLNTADLNARTRAVADDRFEGRGPERMRVNARPNGSPMR